MPFKNKAVFLDWSKLSLGVDLVDIHRFDKIDLKSRFIKNIFTPREIIDCQRKKNFAESLAGRFAAKEAVRKTIKEDVRFNQIEIINNQSGAPEVCFLDKRLRSRYQSLISIAHSGQLAQAVCLTFIIH